MFDSGHGKNRIIHRDTLKRQGVQNATTLNYVCTVPNSPGPSTYQLVGLFQAEHLGV